MNQQPYFPVISLESGKNRTFEIDFTFNVGCQPELSFCAGSHESNVFIVFFIGTIKSFGG